MEFTYHIDKSLIRLLGLDFISIYDNAGSKVLLGICLASLRLGVLPLLDSLILSSGVAREVDLLIREVILNIQRKSVAGLSVDFVVLNVCLAFRS